MVTLCFVTFFVTRAQAGTLHTKECWKCKKNNRTLFRSFSLYRTFKIEL